MIILHSSFNKDYNKLPQKVKKLFKIKRNIFLENPFDPILNNHTLGGKYDGCRSINITGDYRTIYYMEGEIAIFIHIGTHHQLYGK